MPPPHPSRPAAVPPCPTPFVPSGHFPIPSVAARHLPLTRGVGSLTGGIGPFQGGLDRAATWGRPYKNFGPLLSVGADVPIGPRRGHLPQGKAGRAHTVRPYMMAGRSPPHPALRATFPPGGRSGASHTASFLPNFPFSIFNSSFLIPTS